MACKLRCYISSLLVVALSPPPICCISQHNQNPPHKAKATKTQTPTSSLPLVGGTKKSTYLCRVCAPIVFRIATSGSLYNNQQLLAERMAEDLTTWLVEEEKEETCGCLRIANFARARHRGHFLDFWTCKFFHFSRARNATVGVQTLCTLLALLLWTTSTNSQLFHFGKITWKITWQKRIGKFGVLPMGDRFHETLHIFCVRENRDRIGIFNLRVTVWILMCWEDRNCVYCWGFACYALDFVRG